LDGLYNSVSIDKRNSIIISYVRGKANELSNPEQWVHVASEGNPADLASRGCSATQLKQKELWFNGPPFLTTNQEVWKQQTKHMLDTKDPEQRTITNHVLSLIKIDESTTEISHHASFDILVGITAWMLRFGNNFRPGIQRETGPITLEQRAKALQRIVRQIQGIAFQPTITQLQKNGCVAVSDPYRSLDPFLDNTKVLRVGGRLQNSSLAFDEKHPMLLPAGH